MSGSDQDRVAASSAGSAAAAMEALNRAILACRACPRLIRYCRAAAKHPPAAWAGQAYHAAPVPNFGDPEARILLVGLAPAAHGSNRTGRMFTGDRSGRFLFAQLYALGLASQPTAEHAHDGLRLHHVLITAACHCAPPANRPAARELARCAHWLSATIDLLSDLRVVIPLGKLAFDAILREYRRRSWLSARPSPPFRHGACYRFDAPSGTTDPPPPPVLCSYHPSPQNTLPRRLTPAMFRVLLRRAKALAGLETHQP